MLKLFIITLSLFSTIPTFAMRAIKPRLMQRGYATMTQENLTKLINYKGSPEEFSSELAMMKADKEDINKIHTELDVKVKDLEKTSKTIKPHCLPLIVFGASINAMPPHTFGFPVIFMSLGLLLSNEYMEKDLQKNKEILKHLASLIEQNKE